MEQTILNYRVIIEPDKRTGTNKPCFVAFCPTLGLADDGDTIEEALASIKEGIQCYLEALVKDGQGILQKNSSISTLQTNSPRHIESYSKSDSTDNRAA